MGKLRVKYLVIALVFALLAVLGGITAYLNKDSVVFAAFRHGAGTEEDPYRIYNDNQLYNLQEISSSSVARERTKGKYFKLMNNLKGTYRTQQNSYGFYGVLDGNGCTVTLSKYSLFYILKEASTVKNLTVVKNDNIYVAGDVYALAMYINNGATVDNCTFNCNATIYIPSKMTPAPITYTACCKFNNGIIKNCEFNTDISMLYADDENHGKFGYIYIAAVAYGGVGEGTIDNCVVNGNFSLITAGIATFQTAGIAIDKNNVSNCTFNGDIRVKYRSGKIYPFVYGLTINKVTNCVFNGNVYADFTPYKYGIAGTDSTVTHNGEIIITP